MSIEQSPQATRGGDAAEPPRLIFFTALEGSALLAMLRAPGVLDRLAADRHSVALAIGELDEARAEACRLLNARAVPVVAWLLLPPEEGLAFSLRNYPQAVARYHAFRAWAQECGLRFEAVGLDIEPPDEAVGGEQWSLRQLVRRLRLAGENALYQPAQAAYTELTAAIRHDGYEAHTYQVPFIADDRRAGTTLVQRALDIVDVPSDMDVLMCSSSVASEWLDYDLGGALVASYGLAADAIGIGSTGEAGLEDEEVAPLPWPAIRRDLLLAAQHTDMIYVFALEDVVERGLLERIAALDWGARARAAPARHALVAALRGLLFVLLIAGRFGRTTLAWAGWVLAGVLWLRGRRAAKRTTRA